MPYKADIICTNCGYEGNAMIEYGTEVSKKTCPNCGCLTLRRKSKFHFDF